MLRELLTPGDDVIDQLLRQILVHPARAEIVGVQAGAGRALIEAHELFALFKAPQRRGQRAHVHRLGGDVQQMVQDAADFGVEHAHIGGALGHGNAGELLDGQAEGVLLIHRRDVIEAVEIADALKIGLVLQQLLGAAVQKADMRVNALDDFAIQLQHHAQHAVSGGVHRAEIDREIADIGFSHVRRSPAAPWPPSILRQSSSWCPVRSHKNAVLHR